MDERSALFEWQASLNRQLDDLKEKNRLRTLAPHAGSDFSSNDYLALNRSGIIERIAKRLIDEGVPFTGSTGSRLVRGHYEAFDDAERACVEWTGYPSSLFFNTGYAANTGTLQALLSRHDTAFVDRLCHASIQDGIRLSGCRRIAFAHNDPDDLESKLSRHRKKKGEEAWIVLETLYSMDGDLPDLKRIAELAERFGALLYVDEAHAAGIFGPNGGGVALRDRISDRVAVAVYPCGKGPGLSGAFVCGPAPLKPFLVNRARPFLFSTALAPFFATLLAEVIRFLGSTDAETLRHRLFSRIDTMHRLLQNGRIAIGNSASQIIPILVGGEAEALELSRFLAEQGFDLRAIRPPTVPDGSSRLRLCLHADHTDGELERLAGALVEGFGKIGKFSGG